LLEVVEIVTGHGFNNGPEGHGAALRMGGESATVFVVHGSEELHVPGARAPEEVERRSQIVRGVALGPDFLVEGLDDGVRLACRRGEGPAQAESEDEFAVGEVGDDLADAPLSWRRSAIDLLGREISREGAKPIRSGGEDWDRVLSVEVFGVRVEFHLLKLPRSSRESSFSHC
jgi:hypothetical protein